MARRLVHPLLVLLLVAQHGSMALLGVGLHWLPGCGHRVAAAGTADVDRGEGLHPHGPGTGSDDSCPICDHLALGQLVAEPPCGPVSLPGAPCPLVGRPIDLPRLARLASRPRAPPASPII